MGLGVHKIHVYTYFTILPIIANIYFPLYTTINKVSLSLNSLKEKLLKKNILKFSTDNINSTVLNRDSDIHNMTWWLSVTCFKTKHQA